MSIEPIGLLFIVIGIVCLQLGYRMVAATLVVATLFGSAAAILVGSANIQPAHLFLSFVAISTLTRSREKTSAMNAVSLGKPGFWLMCLVIYGVLSGIVMPRLMTGSMPIVPLGVSEYADTGTTVPLSPVSGNFTQAVYLTADFICFVMITAIASTQAGFVTITNALLACAIGNVFFALLDLATYFSGTQWIMDFMRNAQYTLHIEEKLSGLKRIVGSFPEASSFGRQTLGLLGFTGTLWLCGFRPLLTGTLALASLALVVLSTSSAGLVGTPPVLLILYVTALTRRGIQMNRPFSSAAVLCAPLLVVGLILAGLLDEETSKPIRDYVDDLILSKSTSDSGIQRSSWNEYALQNFFDSYGLGVGLGTVRTSSFAVALLANVGVPGTIFYLLFAREVFGRRRGKPRTFPTDVRLAAFNACLGFVIGDVLGSPSVEQGLLFYVLAGIGCAEPERSAEASHVNPAIITVQ